MVYVYVLECETVLADGTFLSCPFNEKGGALSSFQTQKAI